MHFPSHDFQVIPTTSLPQCRQQRSGRWGQLPLVVEVLARSRKAIFAFRKQFTVAVASMRACHDHKRRSSHSHREHVLSKSSTGFKSHASNNADLCYPDKASFEKGDREGRPWSTAIARCHVGRSATPLIRFIHQFDRIRSSSGDRSGFYASMQQQTSRKAKKP